MSVRSQVKASGGDRAQKNASAPPMLMGRQAGVEGSFVSPSTDSVATWEQAARLHSLGSWTDLQYESWSVNHHQLATAPFCDWRRFSNPALLHDKAGGDPVPQVAQKVGDGTPKYKRQRPKHGARGRASRRDLALSLIHI